MENKSWFEAFMMEIKKMNECLDRIDARFQIRDVRCGVQDMSYEKEKLEQPIVEAIYEEKIVSLPSDNLTNPILEQSHEQLVEEKEIMEHKSVYLSSFVDEEVTFELSKLVAKSQISTTSFYGDNWDTNIFTYYFHYIDCIDKGVSSIKILEHSIEVCGAFIGVKYKHDVVGWRHILLAHVRLIWMISWFHDLLKLGTSFFQEGEYDAVPRHQYCYYNYFYCYF